MALAQRNTDWNVPQPPQPRIARPSGRTRAARRPAVVLWQRPLALVGLTLALVAAVMSFIRCSDCIAQRDLRAQTLRQRLTQLDRTYVQLNLELNRMAAEPMLSKSAQANGLVLPDATQIHYTRVVGILPQETIAQAAPAKTCPTLMANIRGFWQRLMPTQPAYGQN
jgi:hypothetical protein